MLLPSVFAAPNLARFDPPPPIALPPLPVGRVEGRARSSGGRLVGRRGSVVLVKMVPLLVALTPLGIGPADALQLRLLP